MSSKHHPLDRSVSRRLSRARPWLFVAVVAIGPLLACNGAIPTPSNDLSSGQAVIDLNAQMVQFREDNALLQAQIDSLRGALAYQDTILRQVAAGAGIQMRAPSVPIP
jgi:hypothetical protein